MALTGIVYHQLYLEHDTGIHVERADRLRAVMELIFKSGIFKKLKFITPRPASVEELAMAHDFGYISRVEDFSSRGGGVFSGENTGCPITYEVARLAAGGAVSAVDAVLEGEVENSFALVRPPGHHAKRSLGMGFCYFNNLAVAALHCRKRGLSRVLVVDWDAHHGNGIESIFYRDPGVLYFSVHGKTNYPGTGHTGNTGEGPGKGYNINIPLPIKSGDEDYLEAFNRVLVPVCRQYSPDIILVAAGQDAYREDPIGGMGVSVEGFGKMGSIVAGLAREVCGGRLVASLEGGYTLGGLARCTVEVIRSFIDEGRAVCPPEGKERPGAEASRVIGQVVSELGKYWSL